MHISFVMDTPCLNLLFIAVNSCVVSLSLKAKHIYLNDTCAFFFIFGAFKPFYDCVDKTLILRNQKRRD